MANEVSGFEVENNPSIWWPVTVEIPVNGGKFEKFRFEAKFRVLSEKEFEALTADKTDKPEGVAEKLEIAATLDANVPKFSALLDDWRGIKRRGVEIPFSPEELAVQVTGKYGRPLSVGLWNAVHEIRMGARLGNSEPLPDIGQQPKPAAEESTL